MVHVWTWGSASLTAEVLCSVKTMVSSASSRVSSFTVPVMNARVLPAGKVTVSAASV